MKKILLGLSFIATVLLIHSCSEDDNNDACQNVTCLNGGTCVNGTCDCPQGFSGDSCQNATTDPCDGVTCLNGGTCVSGACNCPSGYTGDSCQTPVYNTAPFVGYYTGIIHATIPLTDTMTNLNVTDSSAFLNRLFFDSGQSGIDYYGNLTSASAFVIPSQPTPPNNVLISGSGGLSGNTITMTYTLSGVTFNLTVTK